MDSKGVDKPSKRYLATVDAVRATRHAVAGEAIVKCDENITHYLPDPCPDMADKSERRKRFKRYAMNAEFDDVAGNTLESLCGALFRNPAEFDGIPPSMQFMIEDADGDGLTMEELLSISASEMLQMNYLFMLAEYSDLSNVNVEELTVEQSRSMNIRPSIKLYGRESIINWEFRKINGKTQLSMIVLMEKECVPVEAGSYQTKEVDVYLVLELDDDSNYRQRKFIKGSDTNEGEWSEYYYPVAARSNLKYIPGEFCVASEHVKGNIPQKLGYIAPIAAKALYRFKVSADMKEAMWFTSSPITTSTGWDTQALELYKEMTGKEYVAAGAGSHIPLPEGGAFDIHNWNMSESAFADYMDRNEREIRALGGHFDTTEGGDTETATAVIVKAAEKSGALSMLVNNLEQCINKMMEYCGAFLGQVVITDIKLNREFSQHKLNPQERMQILNEWQAGLITDKEALKQLKAGGVLIGEVDELLSMIDNIVDTSQVDDNSTEARFADATETRDA